MNPQQMAPPMYQQQPAWLHHANKRTPFRTLVLAEFRKLVGTTADRILLVAAPIVLVLLSVWIMSDLHDPYTMVKQIGTVTFAIRLSPLLVHLALVKLIAGEWHYRSVQPTLLVQPSRIRYLLAQSTVALIAWLVCAALNVLLTFSLLPGFLETRDAESLLGFRTGWVIGVCVLGSFSLTLIALAVGLLVPNTAGALSTYFVLALGFVILRSSLDAVAWVDPSEPMMALAGQSLPDNLLPVVTSGVLWLALLVVGVVRGLRRDAV
ncbi:MAG: hypothetical protein QOI21_1274 [Actinomycetota bacterium]|jgi:hypothetical protein|nr:hypothetical protein [Actinomycetota bacterium]